MACIGFGKNFLVFSSQVFQSSFIAVALIAAIANSRYMEKRGHYRGNYCRRRVHRT